MAVKRCREQRLVIAQKDVDRYVDLDRAEKRAKAERESLRKDVILPALKSGYECPKGGAHVLTLSSYEERRVDWKTEFFDFAAKRIGEAAAAELMAKIQAETEPMTIEKVLIKENLAYQGTSEPAR